MATPLRFRHALGFAFAGLVLQPAVRGQAPEPFRDTRQMIADRLAKDKIPSLAVAVAKDGKVVWEDAVGWADVAGRRPATPDTVYGIGSVSKPMTATGLMVLVERGRMALDDPANHHLGDAKLRAHVGEVQQATLCRLADHTSGLARHDLFADATHPPLPMDERLRRYGRLLREPGEAYEYSNLGYMILAHVIERRSGTPFDRFLRDEVFLPLGMTNSSVGPDPTRAAATAVHYTADRKPITPPARPDPAGGHGDVRASVRDLLRFGRFHLKEPAAGTTRVLPDAALDRMHRPSSRTATLSWYGLGWRIERGEFAGHTALMHTGQTDGATACLVLIPEHRLCVAAVTNTAHPLPWLVTLDVVKRLIPQDRKPAVPPAGHDRFGRREYKPGAEWVGRWAGAVETHERATPVEMWFEAGGAVRVQMKGQPAAVAGGVRVEDGYLRGSFDGDLGTADIARQKCRLHFKLLRRAGDVLSGSVTATSAPGDRVVTLSHWMEVRRTP